MRRRSVCRPGRCPQGQEAPMIRSFLTAICAMVVLAACVAPAATSSTSSSPSSSPSPASPTPTATPEPSPAALTDWQLVTIPSPADEREATPSAVAAGPDRLVAVGGPVHPAGVVEGLTYGTIWTSRD